MLTVVHFWNVQLHLSKLPNAFFLELYRVQSVPISYGGIEFSFNSADRQCDKPFSSFIIHSVWQISRNLCCMFVVGVGEAVYYLLFITYVQVLVNFERASLLQRLHCIFSKDEEHEYVLVWAWSFSDWDYPLSIYSCIVITWIQFLRVTFQYFIRDTACVCATCD